MHRIWLILTLVLIGCVDSSQEARREVGPIESAAIAEQELQQRRSGSRSVTNAMTDSRQQLPAPFPSEQVPAMTSHTPRGMNSDLVEKQFLALDGATSIPDEPEPPNDVRKPN